MAELKEMVAAKKQTAYLLGKKYKPRKVKRTNYPVALQVSYRKKIMAMVEETDRLIKEILIPELDRLYQEARNQRRDAYAYTDDVTELMNIVRATYADTYSEAEVQAIAAEQAQAVSGFNRRQMTRTFSNALGIELFYNEPWLETEMQGFAKTNVDLITSIPKQYLQDVEGLVQRGLKSGRSVRDIQKDLTARYKGALRNKPRNRAELIARDQTMKLNGDLNHLRQTNLGIAKYTWRTSHDERVRPSHAVLDGKVFKWSDPPDVGHPGEDFQCRCTAEPVIDTSITSLETKPKAVPEIEMEIVRPLKRVVEPKPALAVTTMTKLNPTAKTIFGNYKVTGSKTMKSATNESMNAIAEVYEPKQIKVRRLPVSETETDVAGAIYFQQIAPNMPVKIEINKAAKRKSLAFAHEFGHQIDFTIIRKEFKEGTFKVFSGKRELTDKTGKLMETIRKSPEAMSIKSGTAKTYRDALMSPSSAEYMSRDNELFARAFSQYVAKKSKNKKLLEEVKEVRKLNPFELWDDNNFIPIEKEMEKFLALEG